MIDPVIARKQLGLSKKSFVDFCILSGTDFSGTISGIGPVRALEHIQKYKTIENLLPDLHTINSKYVVQSSLDYKLARRVFKNLPPIPTEDSAYKKPRKSKKRIEKILKLYEIDPIEAEMKVKSAFLQENIADGSDPFKTQLSPVFL